MQSTFEKIYKKPKQQKGEHKRQYDSKSRSHRVQRDIKRNGGLA